MIYCFIIDISSTMNEKLEKSPFSYLDLAKAFIESMLASTKNLPNSHYMLLTSESSYQCLKTSLGESLHAFENEVKNLTTANNINSTEIESSNFSFSLSFALEIVNKYRVKNGIESFCEGIRPWVVDPVNFFILSKQQEHFIGNKNIISLKNTRTSLGIDNVIESYRWDHKLFGVLLVDSNDNLSIHIEDHIEDITTSSVSNSEDVHIFPNFVSLISKMGGEVYMFHSFKQITSSISSIIQKISSLSVHIHMSIQSSTECGSNINNKHMFRMIPNMNIIVGYPIPDKYFIDSNTEHLTIRTSLPCITILNTRDYYEHANDLYHTALALKIPIESYVIDFPLTKLSPNLTNNNSSSENKSIFGSMNLNPHIKYMVCVLNSDRSEKLFSPFGILTSNNNNSNNSNSSSTALLLLFPYNFPLLFNALTNVRNAQISNRPLTSQLSSELINYFKSLPIYCQPSVHLLFQQFGLQQYMPAISTYNKYLLRRVDKMKKIANIDILHLENSFRQRLLKYPLVDISGLALGNISKSTLLPKSESGLNSSDLLATWLHMRQIIYGSNSSSHILKSLSIPGVVGEHCHLEYKGDSQSNGIFATIGANHVNQTSVSAMSRYEERLAIKEVLRDAYGDNPPEDEDLPTGILRRKLSVSFGSKFNNKSETQQQQGGGSSSIVYKEDSIQETMELFTDTPRIYRDDDDNSENETDNISLTTTTSPSTLTQYSMSSSLPSSPTSTTIAEGGGGGSNIFSNNNNSNMVILKLTGGSTRKKRAISLSSSSNSSNISLNTDSDNSVSSTSSSPLLTLLSSPATSVTAATKSAKRSHSVTDIGNDRIRSDIKVAKIENVASSSSSSSSSSSATDKPTMPPISIVRDEAILPEGWIKGFSSKQNKPYWYNKATKKSVWEFPKDQS